MKQFGFSIVFWDILVSICFRFKIFYIEVGLKRNSAIMAWLSKNYDHLVLKYKNMYNGDTLEKAVAIPKCIWVCWWDGIDAMPPIVKACYNSVLKHADGFKVILITKENLNDFLSVPDYIIKKFNKKMISITHFTDIIRMSLLRNHGGFWVDATVLITGDIDFDNTSFFTVCGHSVLGGFGEENISRRRWTGNCIAGSSGIILFDFMYEFFCDYWSSHKELIHYFLIDYAIAFAYNSIPEIKKLIDNVSPNNTKYMALSRHLQNEYTSQNFNEVTENTSFHKLTWKKNYPMVTVENKVTFYGYIIQQNC